VLSNPITEPQIPDPIARDTETAKAIADHEAKTNAHSAARYLTQDAADTRYRLSSTNTPIFTGAALPTASTAGNSLAFGWNSVQPGQGIAELCNYCGLGGGDAFNFLRISGNAATTPSISHRVSRIDISGAYIQTSDRRLKKNFSPSPGLAAILGLSPLKYQHYECEGFEKGKGLKLGRNYINKIGFVAQEVRQNIPEAVHATVSDEELYGIDTGVLLAVAVKAIQELEAKVQELQSQVQTLLKK
jgi:hypothetical protein